MGRTVRMMKRWWVLAVLVTLALSLTSCSKKLPSGGGGLNYGYQFCQGSMCTFDVYVIPSAADPSLFEVSIIPVSLDAAGDIVSIHVANQASLSYKILTPEVVLNEGEEIAVGNLTANDLDVFNVIAIT